MKNKIKNKVVSIWEWLLTVTLDRRVSVSKISKPEDLVISNVSLSQIKRGINRVYASVYGNVRKK